MFNSDTKNNSLLIVDDDKSNLLVLIDILQADYTVYTAKDGEEAIKKAEKYLPDLILLDIIMPGIDGYETLPDCVNRMRQGKFRSYSLLGLEEAAVKKKGLSLALWIT